MKATSISTNAQNQECQVCVTNFTRIKKPIKCPNTSCNFTACSSCYKQFIADNPHSLARCMDTSCKTPFPRTFLHENFTKSFLKNEYKSHLKEIYFQKEQARFPETQELIVCKDKHKKREEELAKLSSICYIDHKHYNLLHLFYIELRHYDTYIDETEEPTIILDENHCYELAQHYIEFGCLPENIEHKKSNEYSHQYHGKCPSTDCRGFITNDYTCGLCNTKVCPDCQEVINQSESHTCNPSTVETIKSISKETKPCPTCHAPIYKIDGCSQMWCVKCHTAFCWNTGNIEKQIHNPHYYEWMRSQNNPIPEQQNIFDFDEIPNPPRLYRQFGNTTAGRIQTLLTDKYTTMKYHIAFNPKPTFSPIITDQEFSQFIKIYYSLCQSVSHFIHNEVFANEFEKETSELRESYLRRNLEEEDYKSRVSAIYKDREFKEIFNKIVQEIFVNNVKSIFENYLYDLSQEIEPENLQQVILNYNQLLKESIQETEREIEKLSTAYGYSQQRFVIDDKNRINIEPVSRNSKKGSLNFAVNKL